MPVFLVAVTAFLACAVCLILIKHLNPSFGRGLLTAFSCALGAYIVAGIKVPLISGLYPFDMFFAPLIIGNTLIGLATSGLWPLTAFAIAILMGTIAVTRKRGVRVSCATAASVGILSAWIAIPLTFARLEAQILSAAETLNANCIDARPLAETLGNASWFDGRVFSGSYYGVMKTDEGLYVWSLAEQEWVKTAELRFSVELPC